MATYSSIWSRPIADREISVPDSAHEWKLQRRSLTVVLDHTLGSARSTGLDLTASMSLQLKCMQSSPPWHETHPVLRPTAKSEMYLDSVSPDLWEHMIPQLALWLSWTLFESTEVVNDRFHAYRVRASRDQTRKASDARLTPGSTRKWFRSG